MFHGKHQVLIDIKSKQEERVSEMSVNPMKEIFRSDVPVRQLLCSMNSTEHYQVSSSPCVEFGGIRAIAEEISGKYVKTEATSFLCQVITCKKV